MLAVNINTGVGSLKEKELKTGKTKNHRKKKPQKDMKVEKRKWRIESGDYFGMLWMAEMFIVLKSI